MGGEVRISRETELIFEGREKSVDVENAFIAVGCNRVVGAISWGPCNLVAFGAHNSVAIFSPEEGRILITLPGHKDYVNCVLWLPSPVEHDSDESSSDEYFLLSGSADGAINLWAYLPVENKWRIASHLPRAHDKAVTCMAAVMLSSSSVLLCSTSSDSTVRIWSVFRSLNINGDGSISLLQSLSVGSRAMVAASLTALPGSQQTYLLALGGLDNHVHFYAGLSTGQFSLVCQVKGHQDWIRALDFSQPSNSHMKDMIFLASSSQDKTIRIWKIRRRVNQSTHVGVEPHRVELSLRTFIDGPVFKAGMDMWQVSLESLLLGHEDWVYSVKWKPLGSRLRMRGENSAHRNHDDEPMCVLSASMDRTMMIWRPDTASGIWMNEVTVGELAQSALGFYGGVWSPGGDAILAHGYSGSFHLWKNINLEAGDWKPHLAPSGHSAPVVDVAWAKTGQFILSVSHDQTARVFACWNWNKEEKSPSKISWHEIGRPQVHGHDLNCLTIVKGQGNHRYLSGADEKVARVFEAPGALLDTLAYIIGGKEDGFNRDDVQILGANMSALGLSQKPIYASGRSTSEIESEGARDNSATGLDNVDVVQNAVPTVLTEPPLEEHLAQNTLWPESYKLYGHGNELFAMCCSHSGELVATACKAQSATFAQIWLWETNSWRPVGQLQSHVLTVTQLEFSHNDRYLLSVSRDRRLSIFGGTNTDDELGSSPPYKLLKQIEAHKRIIWSCSWSHCDRFFATGSRDKFVKIWSVVEKETGVEVDNIITLSNFKSSITALAWGPDLLLAVGMEDGSLELWKGGLHRASENDSCAEDTAGFRSVASASRQCKLNLFCLKKFDRFICHGATVHQLAWRGVLIGEHDQAAESADIERLGPRPCEVFHLVSCGADHAIRLFNVKLAETQTFG